MRQLHRCWGGLSAQVLARRAMLGHNRGDDWNGRKTDGGGGGILHRSRSDARIGRCYRRAVELQPAREPTQRYRGDLLEGLRMLTFNSIDVETANADRASICQIGIIHVRDGKIRDQWKTLIDPEDWFDPWNIEIHGIDETSVTGSPTLPEVRDELRRRLRGSVLVSHTAFDRVAFERAMAKYELEQLQVTWLDSAKIARRAWPNEFGVRGWGLKNIAKNFGISFTHHDALEDAKVAAEIVLRACDTSTLDIDDWLRRVKQPITPSISSATQTMRREGNAEGPLYGETIVFTGALAIPRREAADLAANVGCDVVSSVSKGITMLVVGTQDKNKLNGYDKSSKHRKIENLISQGIDIQILSEQDFFDLAGIDKP